MSEERFIEIEIKISRQEDLVDSLNQIVYQQQKKIDQLEIMLTALAKQSRQSQDAGQEFAPAQEKPPHY